MSGPPPGGFREPANEPPSGLDLDALRRAEASLRAYAHRGRQRIEVGAFTYFVTTNNPNPFLSVAVPVPEEDGHRHLGSRGAPIEPLRSERVSPWDGSIEQLARAAADHGLRPRLEYMAELHPRLAPALLEAGFHETGNAPVMVLSSVPDPPEAEPDTHAVVVSSHVEHRDLAEVDEATLRDYVDGQSAAFDIPLENGRAWLSVLRDGLRDRTVRAALLESDGRVVAGATLQVAEPAAELAGVWTTPELRRRGLASRLCRRLLRDAAMAGVDEVWLSAAEGALGLYLALGFRRVGTQRNFER